MKPKIWNRTTIVWNFSNVNTGKTNIPVDDWHDEKEKFFHSVHGLQIMSLNEDGGREALMKIRIFRVSIAPTTCHEKIVSKLMNFVPGITGVHTKEYSETFSVRYTLGTGETFCDSAINAAKALFEALGIEDKGGYIITNFLAIQENLVKTEKGVIPFSDYLREKHGLKQHCSLWKRNIQIEGATFNINYGKAESNWLHRND